MKVAQRENQFSHPIFQALEKVVGAVLWVDVEGKIVHVNDEVVKLTGFSGPKLKNAPLTKLEPRLNAAAFEQRWEALRKKQTTHWESEFVNVDGTRFPVSLHAIQVEVDGLLLACIHITAARGSTTRVDFLNECLTRHKIATWEWDLVSGSLYVSDFFYEFFGLEKGQQLSRENILHVLKPHLSGKQLEALKEGMDELRKTPTVVEKEVTLYQGDGTERKIQLGLKPWFEHGIAVAIQGYLRELPTPPKSSAESFARKMMNFSKEWIFWVNPDLSIRYANPTALKALGYTEEEATTALQWSHIDLETSVDHWNEVIQNGKLEKKVTRILELRRKDGQPIPVECFFSFVDMEPHSMFYVSAQEANQIVQPERNNLHASLLETMRLSRRLEKERNYLQAALNATYDNIVTLNDNYKAVLRKVEEIAQSSIPVLIQGEAGSGKRLLARTLHQLSNRSSQPFITVDCSRFPLQLLEKELFGYGKGSLLDSSYNERIGWIETAEGGTLLFDEIDGLPPILQEKLLRIILEGRYERPGSNKILNADIRVVATTARDLDNMTYHGAFHQDLLSQFSKGIIHNIPLRERKSDIPVLIQYFLKKFSQETGKGIPDLNAKDLEQLINYDFPGNVRELQNIIALSMRFGQDGQFPSENWQQTTSAAHAKTIPDLDEIQRQHILDALKIAGGKVSGKNGAAELLNVNAQTLFSKMRKLGIKLP